MTTTMNDFNMENMSLQEKIQAIFKFHNGLAIQDKLKETKGPKVNYIHSDSGYLFSTDNAVLKINESGSVEADEIQVDESIVNETKTRISKTTDMLNSIWR